MNAKEDKIILHMKHMEKIMNEGNKWDHMVETNIVEGAMEKGKANGPSKVSVEMIVASGEIGA